MIGLLLFLTIALLAAMSLWWLVRGQARPVTDWEVLPDTIEPVDLAAFRNLADPAEDAWLRAQLSAADYAQVRRERIAAAVEYVSRSGRNAAVLIRLGQAAAQSADPALAAAGRELVVTGMRTRWYTLQATLRLKAARLLPGASMPVSLVSEQYQNLRDRVDRVSRLRSPVLAARMGAAM